MEDYYEYLDSNGVTTLYKLIKDDTVALIDSYSVTINGITTTLDTHINDSDIHTPISDIESMVDTKISGLVNSAPETLDTLKELSDALGNDTNFATTVANQIGNKANKDSVYTREEADTLLESKANSVHSHVVSDITDFPTIPTKLSQLENDMGFGSGSGGVITSISWTNITDKPNFATVATSGSYNDLSNKPTIPKVYNKTLTIQKNGTNVATFTSNSNTDVTANITVPTKTSDLTNDSGFITGISWDKVTNKPTLATVATSGSYTDLSNTPTIPTKVSQLENDTGFINALTDVVDTKSNQTINGIKTFTNGPLVTNNGTTIGFSIKNTAIGRGEVPSEIYHNTFRVYDKNTKIMGEFCVEKSNSGSTLAHINVRSEDANGKQILRSVYFNMSNDGTKTSFYPNVTNDIDLGMSQYKWANVYATNAYINNTYTNRVTTYSITHPTDDSYFFMSGGSDYNKGATLYLGGVSATNFTPGRFALAARKTDGSSVELAGSPNGTLTWGGKNIGIDENLVHRSGDETINGIKVFTDTIYKKNSALDLQVNPSSNQYNSFLFIDKNNVAMGYLEHLQTTTGINALGLVARDKNNGSHGIQITSEDNVIPLGNGVVNLGLSGSKWKNVYATTFNGNLKGNADTATSANDPNAVHKTGNETITGNKTFSNKIKGNLQGNADTASRANADFEGNTLSGVVYYDNNCIRYSNGLQICWGSKNNDNTYAGGIFIIPFSKPFSDAPRVTLQSHNPDLFFVTVRETESTHFNVGLFMPSHSNTTLPVLVNYIAIGKWK